MVNFWRVRIASHVLIKDFLASNMPTRRFNDLAFIPSKLDGKMQNTPKATTQTARSILSGG